MENYVIKNCEGCHKPLRIPTHIGGMLMRCPSCGYEFHTDFKLNPKIQNVENCKESANKTRVQRPPSTFRIIA